ncbi:MAG: isoleucine--tRNA ligase, partial [Verrucomicrobia bacterium]|nr:isoleucine--tRNA ligase [Verrucomicrobiota bacterium]
VIPRYKTMKGYCVPRRFGWDCHGLPVENEIEKAKGLTGAASIEAFGVANFNEECRNIVLRYAEEWKSIVLRMGRWVDFKQTFMTMDLSFMESVWWVFKELYKKGLVYEGYRVMPYSAKLGTPLSNFEATENYKEVDDPSVTVMFPLVGNEDTSLLAWTTTPWTLISNLAVAVGPDIDYALVQDPHSHKKFIIAESRIGCYFKHPEEELILARMKGRDLDGKAYVPAFNYFASMREKGAFRVIADEFVTTEDGTGLVHCAPGFGEADFYACQKRNIPVVCPVDQNGQFTTEIAEFQGRFVKECDKEIIRHLKQEGRVLKHETMRHRYPFCWRSDTPLIYKAMSTWFVRVEQIKEKLLAANDQIAWMPHHVKHGRFGKWLEGARDWNISRNRYWGTPIPLWRAEDGEILVVGSIQELKELAGVEAKDLHRHFIDHLKIEKDGKVFTRIPEVFDCWFESGSMPYAQNHYPFESAAAFDKTFPADFIAEGLDQTRGWFYTLTVLAAALFEKPAFKNVVVNGIVLAADGTKMSKRLKNYPDPVEMLNKYGADAVRLYMLNSPAVKAEDLCFSEPGVETCLRQVLIPLWNSYSFFITYARLYQFQPQETTRPPQAAIDRWVLSKVQKLIHDVELGMDGYDLSQSVFPFIEFIEQLTNWYIRRSRRRFWSDEASTDRQEAFETLYTVLVQLSKVIAPFIPFIAESVYRNLRKNSDPISVHLTDYPHYQVELRDQHLEEAMQKVQDAASLGHSLRKEHQLKVRQPLKRAYIISADATTIALLKEEQALIGDELNVQEVVFSSDESQFVRLKAKPNFRVLGKKLGSKMKQAHQLIEQFSHKELEKLMAGESVDLVIDGETFMLTPEEVHVEREVKEGIIAANSGKITVALDTELTDELLMLGLAREIVNKLNLMRKEVGLEISDRIHVSIDTTERVKKCINEHRDAIASEILALSFTFGPCQGGELDLNGEKAVVAIIKA